jgi:hypothetical protein
MRILRCTFSLVPDQHDIMESSRNDLAAPQHLDRALYVTTPKAWLALCMLLVMIVAVVA